LCEGIESALQFENFPGLFRRCMAVPMEESLSWNIREISERLKAACSPKVFMSSLKVIDYDNTLYC